MQEGSRRGAALGHGLPQGIYIEGGHPKKKKLVLKDTCGGADAGTQSSNFKRVGLVYSPNLTATIPALCPEGECLTVK